MSVTNAVSPAELVGRHVVKLNGSPFEIGYEKLMVVRLAGLHTVDVEGTEHQILELLNAPGTFVEPGAVRLATAEEIRTGIVRNF
ncbi:hypothetical protein EniLVp02_0097 [Vibrio phage EniLVp02]